MLTLKKENPSAMKDLRPISLWNVLYKILSKVLANQLKPLLPKCVSLEQLVFVEVHPGQCFGGCGTIHHKKCTYKVKKREVALIVDMSIAYDCVEWDYVLTRYYAQYGILSKNGWSG